MKEEKKKKKKKTISKVRLNKTELMKAGECIG